MEHAKIDVAVVAALLVVVALVGAVVYMDDDSDRTYYVTYHTNGGIEMGDRPFTKTTETFQLDVPQKAGCTFLGWYGNSELTGAPITQVAKGTANDIGVWAKWMTQTSSIPTAEQMRNATDIAVNLESGATEAQRTVPADVINEIKAGKTLTVNSLDGDGNTVISWTFNGADSKAAGSHDSVNTTVTPDTSLLDTENKIVLVFEYEGKLPYSSTIRYFVGTSYAGQGMTVKNSGDANPIGNYTVDSDGYITFTIDHCSDWELTFYYTVVFDLDGGSGSVDPVIGYLDDIIAQPIYSGTRQFYTFDRWIMGDNVFQDAFVDGTMTITQSLVSIYADESNVITVSAVWDKTLYTVRFDINGGTGTVPSDYHWATIDTTVTFENASAVKGDLFFGGWGTKADGSGRTYSGSCRLDGDFFEFAENGIVTLYAKWVGGLRIGLGDVFGTTMTFYSSDGATVELEIVDTEYVIRSGDADYDLEIISDSGSAGVTKRVQGGYVVSNLGSILMETIMAGTSEPDTYTLLVNGVETQTDVTRYEASGTDAFGPYHYVMMMDGGGNIYYVCEETVLLDKVVNKLDYINKSGYDPQTQHHVVYHRTASGSSASVERDCSVYLTPEDLGIAGPEGKEFVGWSWTTDMPPTVTPGMLLQPGQLAVSDRTVYAVWALPGTNIEWELYNLPDGLEMTIGGRDAVSSDGTAGGYIEFGGASVTDWTMVMDSSIGRVYGFKVGGVQYYAHIETEVATSSGFVENVADDPDGSVMRIRFLDTELGCYYVEVRFWQQLPYLEGYIPNVGDVFEYRINSDILWYTVTSVDYGEETYEVSESDGPDMRYPFYAYPYDFYHGIYYPDPTSRMYVYSIIDYSFGSETVRCYKFTETCFTHHNAAGFAYESDVEERAYGCGVGDGLLYGAYVKGNAQAIDLMLTAKPFSPEHVTAYDVVFDGNGGTILGEAVYDGGMSYNVPYVIADRDIYEFQSWNTKADGTGHTYLLGEVLNPSDAVDGTVTLYAMWAPAGFRVTFDANGGTGSVPQDMTGVRLGDYVNFEIPGAVREGKYFGGWNTKADGTGNTYGLIAGIDEGFFAYADWNVVTLYVKWVGGETQGLGDTYGIRYQAFESGGETPLTDELRAGYVIRSDARSYDFELISGAGTRGCETYAQGRFPMAIGNSSLADTIRTGTATQENVTLRVNGADVTVPVTKYVKSGTDLFTFTYILKEDALGNIYYFSADITGHSKTVMIWEYVDRGGYDPSVSYAVSYYPDTTAQAQPVERNCSVYLSPEDLGIAAPEDMIFVGWSKEIPRLEVTADELFQPGQAVVSARAVYAIWAYPFTNIDWTLYNPPEGLEMTINGRSAVGSNGEAGGYILFGGATDWTREVTEDGFVHYGFRIGGVQYHALVMTESYGPGVYVCNIADDPDGSTMRIRFLEKGNTDYYVTIYFWQDDLALRGYIPTLNDAFGYTDGTDCTVYVVTAVDRAARTYTVTDADGYESEYSFYEYPSDYFGGIRYLDISSGLYCYEQRTLTVEGTEVPCWVIYTSVVTYQNRGGCGYADLSMVSIGFYGADNGLLYAYQDTDSFGNESMTYLVTMPENLLSAESFDLVLSGNGGTIADKSEYDCGTMCMVPRVEPELPGCSFVSWNTAPDGSGRTYQPWEQLNPADAVGGRITLYAVWDIIEYTVVFDINGGSGTVPEPIVGVIMDSDTAIELPCPDAVKAGKYFGGWNTEPDGTGITYPVIAVLRSDFAECAEGSIITLYVKWVDGPAIGLGDRFIIEQRTYTDHECTDIIYLDGFVIRSDDLTYDSEAMYGDLTEGFDRSPQGRTPLSPLEMLVDFTDPRIVVQQGVAPTLFNDVPSYTDVVRYQMSGETATGSYSFVYEMDGNGNIVYMCEIFAGNGVSLALLSFDTAAHWGFDPEETYTVTYYADPSAGPVVRECTEYLSPGDLGIAAPAGKQFAGWYWEAPVPEEMEGEPFQVGQHVFSDRTVYAVWEDL